jgi:hypothetical protein
MVAPAESKHSSIDLLSPFPAGEMKDRAWAMTLARLGLRAESHPHCRMLLQTS